PPQPAQPGAEGGLRQVGEEGGDEDRVEGLGADELLGVGVRNEAVDAEGSLLEADAARVDVRHPDVLGRNVEHRETGHPAIAAGEVQELEMGGQGTETTAETPAQNGRHRPPNATPRVEIEDKGLVPVAGVEVEVVEEHLVLRVDVEVHRGEAPGGEA